jgi:hypothetical protein
MGYTTVKGLLHRLECSCTVREMYAHRRAPPFKVSTGSSLQVTRLVLMGACFANQSWPLFCVDIVFIFSFLSFERAIGPFHSTGSFVARL